MFKVFDKWLNFILGDKNKKKWYMECIDMINRQKCVCTRSYTEDK